LIFFFFLFSKKKKKKKKKVGVENPQTIDEIKEGVKNAATKKNDLQTELRQHENIRVVNEGVVTKFAYKVIFFLLFFLSLLFSFNSKSLYWYLAQIWWFEK